MARISLRDVVFVIGQTSQPARLNRSGKAGAHEQVDELDLAVAVTGVVAGDLRAQQLHDRDDPSPTRAGHLVADLSEVVKREDRSCDPQT